MAQVYSFVDENGVTRLFAEIHPDPAGTPFNGGTITGALTVNTASGDPLLAEVAGAEIFRADGTTGALEVFQALQISATTTEFAIADSTGLPLSTFSQGGGVALGIQAGVAGCYIDPNGLVELRVGAATSVISSGALPTHSFSSGTAGQLSTTRDVNSVTPFTGDGTNNAATLKIELSPNNVTFSTLDTLSIAAALNLSGALNIPVSLAVPAAFYVKLTATHGTIGTTTYY